MIILIVFFDILKDDDSSSSNGERRSSRNAYHMSRSKVHFTDEIPFKKVFIFNNNQLFLY